MSQKWKTSHDVAAYYFSFNTQDAQAEAGGFCKLIKPNLNGEFLAIQEDKMSHSLKIYRQRD